MLRLIQRAIAYIRTMMGGATPTQLAGHAPQEPTTLAGKATTALGTKPQSRARPRSSKKPKVAQSTTAAQECQSKKQEPVPTGKTPSTRGSSTQTPASKTRRPALPAPTKKPKVAASTTQAKKATPSKTRVQTRTAPPSKALGS